MSLRICVLASGSSGNSTAIWTGDSGILIDCGCSQRYMERMLQDTSMSIGGIKGIVVTHGHSDHVSPGAVGFAKRHSIPFYIHKDTYCLVQSRNSTRKIAELGAPLVRYHSHRKFQVGRFLIEPIPVFHSGGCTGEPFGFRITADAGTKAFRIGYLTDTGTINDTMVKSLLDCHVLVLEANHDPELVRVSRRHYLNKKWILGDYGHLNNSDAAETIRRIKERSDDGNALKYVFVAHISKEHNTIDGALRQIEERLCACGIEGVRLLPTYHGRRSSILKIT